MKQKFQRIKPSTDKSEGIIAKQVLVGSDKVINVRKFSYSDREIEAILRIMAHLNAVRDDMMILQGTSFYSKKIDDLFDVYYTSKLRPVFLQNPGNEISDLVLKMTQTFSKMASVSYELSLQPDKVQDRYNRENTDLLISCGISTVMQ